MGISEESLKKTIKEHPHAKAVFVINPTYYGAVSDLKAIVRAAHRHEMAVLVDEAHGAHMSFHDDFPLTAMEVGADMSASSMHKTSGSMSQSSVLLLRSDVISPERVRQVLSLTHTPSASYVLMCSLDVARKQMATNGDELLEETLELARWARDAINTIEGLNAFGKELIGTPGCFDFDETKLSIHVAGIGYTGYQIETILRRDYNIQIELSDMKTERVTVTHSVAIPKSPEMLVSPRSAFYSPKKVVALEDSIGEIAGEMVMAYPPGIPVICMGERISKEIVAYIQLLKEQNCELHGMADPLVNHLRVLGTN
ncbi:aminotransferase class V-fold PLP-dependent enzyme [Paenibacillus sp. GSMTC-2017]|uniref:aminotransferase class I/II-fold pyridoxal phosphate-dependent enzyme n=1 Tax=Paenibacillus sp. GSMTC-2017 TaxID=2794350 RepID=UPI001A1B14FD|nr:hypothetical protein [Paenibacillus sp. GSMTC-2017]MBH5318855.1 aminotransferase class V-fold PLP-dependent enzyme [Paenibacillus sp. GSMTC-2017]